MHQDLRERIRAATEESGITKPAFVELLRLVSQHYDKMEATITQSVETRVLRDNTPIEAIFDSVTDALLSVGADGVIRNCNKVCARYFGIPKNKLIGSEIVTILPEARGQSLARFLSPFMTSVDDTHIESDGHTVQAMRAGSKPFVSEIRASKLEITDGPIFVISVRDVTDRNHAESALRENEERYRALVENAPDAIIVFDVDENRFTDANDNACTLFNLSRARLLKVGPDAISPKMQPDGTPSFGVRRGHLDRALAGEHPTFEWLHKDSTGREFPCEVRFSRLPSDERRLIRVSITDITDRKRHEASSFAQNKVLEMIAANTPHDSTLRAICRYSEKIGKRFKVAIMRLDAKSQTLSVEQAPSLSDSFKLCLEFIKVDADSLTCGAAVHERQDRITEDIREDAR
ncbi:MAG: PAS domain S-box protein, partial [Gammaproteobacteria bacterium]|nr:PAS domain S-box protein [Gammaproteobacteria bacterium]NNL45172.1 PAS domain S-box protein [Woeseiaceae bacterium]